MSTIGVVGAGLAGLTAALRLVEAGHEVDLYERYPRPGGLARVFEVGGELLEMNYHHIFTSDTAYLDLAQELGLADAVEWLPSRMGIWTEGRLWDFGTPLSLLKFGPMSLLDKLRFAASTMLLRHWPDPGRFEHVTAAEWVQRHQGRRVWQTVWGPLFHQKFADRAEQVAMVWLWGKLRLRGGSRSRSGLGECLGYMRGSFDRLVQALSARIEELGGRLHLRDAVTRIERHGERLQLITRRQQIARDREGKGRTQAFDRVVAAVPIPDYLQIAGHLLPPAEHHRLSQLRATAALCTVLELEHSLSPYYWLNIADPEMPFGGLIEHTNYIPAERYGGRRILYISNYMMPDARLYRRPKDEVLESYLPGLQRINPDFDPSWILASHHFRADYAQPLVTVGYRALIPDFRTPVPGLYLTSMGQIFPEDRGMNYAVAYGDRVARRLLADLHDVT